MQVVYIDLIPQKEKPVVNASQFDNNRSVRFMLTENGNTYTLAGTEDVTCEIRKPDGNIVIITLTIGANSYVDVDLTEQACACYGQAFGEISIKDNDDVIGTCNFILDVEVSPTAGGIQSASEIDNLTEQIEDIISGEGYLKSDDVALVALSGSYNDLTDKPTIPDMSNYYTKSETYNKTQVDDALSLKANSADLATVATSGDYDDLINKPTIPAAQVQSDYAQADNTQVDYIKNKPDISGMIADALLAVMPVETVGPSAVCNFNTDIATNLVNVKCAITATGGGGTPNTPIPIVGYSSLNLTHCGVNLFDKTADDATNGYKDNYYIAPDGTDQYNASYAISEYIPLKGGVNITLNGAVGYNPSMAFYDLSKTLISASNYSGTNPCTKTTPNGTAFVRFSISKPIIDTTQLEIGNQASSYLAYNGTTDTIALGSIVYGGELDVTSGVLTITHALLEKVVADMNNNENYPGWRNSGIKALIGDNLNERFRNQVLNIGTEFSVNTISTSDELYLDKTTYILTQSQWIATYPNLIVQILVPLTTPLTVQLTAQQVQAILGDNNIFADTGDSTVQYKVSIQKYIDERT